MGRKRAGKRQYFLFYCACCLIFIIGPTACSLLPTAWQARNDLSQAKTFLAKGNYDAALRETEKALSSHLEIVGDEALYLIGLIYAHPKNPGLNLIRSIESFQVILKKHPHSAIAPKAEVWVSILRKTTKMDAAIFNLNRKLTEKQLEIRGLKTQIDNLKKIDLGIEEKKRGTSAH